MINSSVRVPGGVSGVINMSGFRLNPDGLVVNLSMNSTYHLVLRASDGFSTVETIRSFVLNVSAPNTSNSTPNILPSVFITYPLNNSNYIFGSYIVVNATASDQDGYVTRVEFYRNGSLLFNDSSVPYFYSWMNAGVGRHVLRAKAFDNATGSQYSSNITVDVLSFVCVNDSVQNCSTGLFGVCGVGTRSCLNNSWSVCVGPSPSVEVCNGFDDDCDNLTDEGCSVPFVFISFPVVNGSYVRVNSSLSFSGRVNDSDSSSLIVSWFVDRIGDGVGGVLVKNETRGVGVSNGSVVMGGFRLNPAGQNVSLQDNATYYIILQVSDGFSVVDTVRSFVLVPFGNNTNSTPNILPSVFITNPLNNSNYVYPSYIVVNATASDSDGFVTRVEFYRNGSLLFNDSSVPHSYSWTNAGVGSHVLRAKAFDNATGSQYSSNVTVNVVQPSGSDVGLYTVYEQSFTHSGTYANPYYSVTADANVTTPSGKKLIVPMFWDGGSTWKFRIAPKEIGTYTYVTISADSGLNSKSGSFTAINSDTEGFIVRDPVNSYAFKYSNSDSNIFLMGDTCWNCFSTTGNLTYDTFKQYIDIRASQKFNFVRSYVVPFYIRTDKHPYDSIDAPQHRNEGGIAFIDWDRDKVNPAYFSQVEERIKYANSKGITMHLVVGGDEALMTGFFGWDNNNYRKMERYIRYVVARFDAYNVNWEGRAEIEDQWEVSPGYMVLGNAIGNWIEKYGAHNHLQSMHTLDSTTWDRRTKYGPEFANENWLDWQMQQAGVPHATKEYNYSWSWITRDRAYGKPVMNEEFFYELMDGIPTWWEHHVNADTMRKGAWQVMVHGASGFAFANTGTVNARSQTFAGLQYAVSNGSKYMTYLYNFFQNTEYWKLAPSNVCSLGYCLVNPDKEYVVYSENVSQFTVQVGAGTYSARFYNPRTGTYNAATTVVGGASRTFTKPDSNDWVLHLKTSQSLSGGISLANKGTDKAYFTYRGKPLLSFGSGSDFLFHVTKDSYDYTDWANWASENGMNHLRAYLPWSYKYIDNKILYCEGNLNDALYPYKEHPSSTPQNRKFNLDEFNEEYWIQFREQMDYLESKGIIVHFLMVNGWQSNTDWGGEEEGLGWQGHFFNPDNNVNQYTEYLRNNPKKIYSSVSDGQTQLVEAQKRWYRKIIQETQGYDNVYYDLVHEMADHQENFLKSKEWVQVMLQTVRNEWSADKPIILAIDTGGFDGDFTVSDDPRGELPTPNSEIDQLLNLDVDLAIYGKKHHFDSAKNWRIKYDLPYIPQESWDDSNAVDRWGKYDLGNPDNHIQLRKYIWKFMMAKVQQIDFYYHPKAYNHGDSSIWQWFESPRGINKIEEHSKILRAFWEEIEDYPNLWFQGEVESGVGSHKYVLSSNKEAIIYLSSATIEKNKAYGSSSLILKNMALNSGTYSVDIWSPVNGKIDTKSVVVTAGKTTISLPAFVDDIAVHMYFDSTNPPNTSGEVIQDSLIGGSTKGVIVGGTFTSEGYKPGLGENHILYDIPEQIMNGYVEFEVKGFNFSQLSTTVSEQVTFLIMYDGRGITEPIPWWRDYRSNFFRWDVFYRGIRPDLVGAGDRFKGKMHTAPQNAPLTDGKAIVPEVTGTITDNYWNNEPNGLYASWNPNTWYKIRVEWDNTNKEYRIYRDGIEYWHNKKNIGVPFAGDEHFSSTSPYNWLPINFKIWLGSGPGDTYDNKMPNIVYRNFTVVKYN